jgi:hypothetical protein
MNMLSAILLDPQFPRVDKALAIICTHANSTTAEVYVIRNVVDRIEYALRAPVTHTNTHEAEMGSVIVAGWLTITPPVAVKPHFHLASGR